MSDDPPLNEIPAPGTPAYFVGIGASAGGLEALETFFSAAPPTTGCADRHSAPVARLQELDGRAVCRSEPRCRCGVPRRACVEANTVYLIPPRRYSSIFHQKLLLTDIDPRQGTQPADRHLPALAGRGSGRKGRWHHPVGHRQRWRAWLRAIKEAGGMVMAQSPESAKFDGMPRAAIDTGLVDVVLPPEEMPSRLSASCGARSPPRRSFEPAVARRGWADAHLFAAAGAVQARLHLLQAEHRAAQDRTPRIGMPVRDLREYVRLIESKPSESRHAVSRTADRRNQLLSRP
jgi:hypothetical protein